MKNLAYTLTDIEAANAPNTDPAESYVRPLGSFEHLLWLLDQANPRHFSLAAQIEGPTTVGDWRVALDHVQRRHPFFSVCIEKDRNSNPKFRQVPDRTIPLRVVRMDASQPNWLAELQREVATSFDPELAPLVRAVLMYEPHRATLILTAHHSIISAAAVSFEPNGETAFWELARFAKRKLARSANRRRRDVRVPRYRASGLEGAQCRSGDGARSARIRARSDGHKSWKPPIRNQLWKIQAEGIVGSGNRRKFRGRSNDRCRHCERNSPPLAHQLCAGSVPS